MIGGVHGENTDEFTPYGPINIFVEKQGNPRKDEPVDGGENPSGIRMLERERREGCELHWEHANL